MLTYSNGHVDILSCIHYLITALNYCGSPALYQPNDMRFEGGLVAIQIENKLIKKLAKSDSM